MTPYQPLVSAERERSPAGARTARRASGCLLLFGLASSVVGCGGDDEVPPWAGTYEVQGTWDLSGSLGADKTVGDAVVDVLLGQLVTLGGIPGPVEDEVSERLDGLVRGQVRDYVDANLPEVLQPSGAVTSALRTALAAVEVQSQLTLTEGESIDEVEGTETIMRLTAEGASSPLPIMLPTVADSGVDARWKGEAKQGDVLEIEPYSFEVGYGALVREAANQLAEVTSADMLAADVREALECSGLVGAALGDEDGLEISVLGISYGFGRDKLTDACEAIRGRGTGRALGLFAVDTGIQLQGRVRWIDADMDGAAERLESDADYGGRIDLAPGPLAPLVAARFVATRRE